ncbi:hypothetical protein AB0E64_37525 [Streptomyces caelestis]|uniref:Uncharacterized protein n=1 Tax=Streptomyces caelestis TaxID=36816 RepID=A0A7W9GZK0_9ACTN|nr:hypothetical protein [Streptomyces caelestis]MBB5792638.1 hypothetical protein [Streptomyces caelestis]
MPLGAKRTEDAHVPVPPAAAEQLHLLGERAGLGAREDSSVVTVSSPQAREGEGR